VCSANHTVSSSRRQCTRKDRNIYTDKQTNSHICCQCTTVTDTQQYNTTHNTRVQLTIPSAHHTVTAHAKTEVYTQTNRQTDTGWREQAPSRHSAHLPPPSTAHFANCHRQLAGENAHHPDTVSICSHLLSPLHVQFPHAYEWPPYRCATQSLRKTLDVN